MTLRQEVAAPKLDSVAPSRAFVASLLRAAVAVSASETAIKAAVDQALTKERATIAKRIKEDANREILYLQKERDILKASIADFEAASGLRIGGYNGRKLGATVAFVLNTEAWQATLHRYKATFSDIGQKCDAAIAELAKVDHGEATEPE
jgi:hypothetical protein